MQRRMRRKIGALTEAITLEAAAAEGAGAGEAGGGREAQRVRERASERTFPVDSPSTGYSPLS